MGKMKNVFFVWGYGGSPDSTTIKNLKQLVGDKYNIISDYYAQYNPVEAIKDIEYYIKEYKVDILIGSSLGGFIVSQIKTDIPKIIINPCMEPAVELPLLKDENNEYCVPKHIIDFYTEYTNKNNIWETISANDIFIIGSEDELFGTKYVEQIKQYTDNIHIVPQKHHNTFESIRDFVVPVLIKI